MGKNWNSKTGKFEQIKSQEIKDLADKAKRLKASFSFTPNGYNPNPF
jgi:hypothetical protein